MQVRILAAGRPALGWAAQAVDDYLRRLARFGRYRLDFVKAGPPDRVSRDLLARSAGGFRVALDERGRSMDTRGFADHLGALEMRGDVRTLWFLVGAADGHSEQLRREADLVLSLSPLTLQHEFALVLLLEQLYRVADLRRGGPYHR